MTDYDADEIVRQRRRDARTPMIDRLLGALGLAMAAFATFFPWYALLHQDEFSMPTLWQETSRDLPERRGRDVVSVSPLAMPDKDDGIAAAIDRLTTATVPGPERDFQADKNEAEAGPDQPFPASPRFKLMHVANGRALIEDEGGMYVVRVGSVLPDNSRLATFEQRDGRWVMITSKGEIYQAR
ncbi:flagellar protein [Ensifer sp. LCM 4579]|uniref:flagellar protein n=1 Tax=Ensifer sp. LCM 4579 TaxID=1848292 RepID=UPI0008DA76D5|nr:flagellar protein [Ensifer sp. LCM 4579]OHV85856.1 flagellar protein [Ensifer sp. LCM 4579]